MLLSISRHHMLNLHTDFSISIIISSVSGRSALIAWSATKLNAADCGSRFIAVTFNLPLTERRHLSCLSLWDSLICSEKSLALRRDYPLIINHIQTRENKFCLHVFFSPFVREEPRVAAPAAGLVVHLPGQDKAAEHDLRLLQFFLSFFFFIQINHPLCKRLIWPVASLLCANKLAPAASGSLPPSWQQMVSCSDAAETGGVNLLYRRSNRGASSCLLLPLFFLGLCLSPFTDLVG